MACLAGKTKAMTNKEAIAMLEQHNITRSLYDTTHLVLHHDDGTCEQIGEIWTGTRAIYIADYIPSHIGQPYEKVHKTLAMLDSPLADSRLLTLIKDLPSSAKRYEEATRKERLENLQEYFKSKKK